jgi:hypothetical protein
VKSAGLLSLRGDWKTKGIVPFAYPDGKSVSILRDSSGGDWYDQVETRVKNADGTTTNITSNYAKDSTTLLSRSTETINSADNSRVEDINADGVGSHETKITETVTTDATGIKTTTIVTRNFVQTVTNGGYLALAA